MTLAQEQIIKNHLNLIEQEKFKKIKFSEIISLEVLEKQVLQFCPSLQVHFKRQNEMQIDKENKEAANILPVSSSSAVFEYFQVLIFHNFYKQKLKIDLSLLKLGKIDEFNAKLIYYTSLLLITPVNTELTPVTTESNETLTLFMKQLRYATVNNHKQSLATVSVAIIRFYIKQRQIEEANLFMSKIEFPKKECELSVLSRWYYYCGYVKALRLEYSDSLEMLRQGSRMSGHFGFLQKLYKLMVLVQLLVGEFPEKSLFSTNYLNKPLHPYFELVKAVYAGDMYSYEQTLQKNSVTYKKDGLLGLVKRLRHNVIRTGLKSISVAYSRIPLRDVAIRLGIDSEQSVEYILQKCIKDNVLLGGVFEGEMRGLREEVEESAFGDRIEYLFGIVEECLKGLRYPDKKKQEVVGFEELREIEREIVEMDEDDLGF